jgi:hypothetical protein
MVFSKEENKITRYNNLELSKKMSQVNGSGLDESSSKDRHRILLGNSTSSEQYELLFHPAGNSHYVIHRAEVY